MKPGESIEKIIGIKPIVSPTKLSKQCPMMPMVMLRVFQTKKTSGIIAMMRTGAIQIEKTW